jgi:AcrR family transcriptional regulator
MAVLVEHEKRKSEILEKSLQLFCEEGYEDVTFQKIADRCGITRTTLYIYFKNKREIFLFSIKQMVAKIDAELVKIVNNEEINTIDGLKNIMNFVLEEALKNSQLFKVLLPYLTQLQKSGTDIKERVDRRVIRIRHLLSNIIITGQKKGEIKKIPVKDINNLLYTFMEDTVFRLALFGQADSREYKDTISFLIDQFKES